MTKYTTQERAKYWPVSSELLAQYKDGSYTRKYGGDLYWTNQDGQVHRDGDKPAIIDAYGGLDWRQNGERHRDGDKPAYIGANGSLYWWQNGLLHRDGDKPAYIGANGSLAWHQNGQRHRLHGPARIHPDGSREWWINHKHSTQEVNAWLDGKEWRGTPEQIFEFQLRFS